MALDVKVKIELSKTTGSVGFGVPLLLEVGAAKATAYTECYSLDDVVTLGYENTSEMYKAANLLFMQENRPQKIAVSAISSPVAANDISALCNKAWRQLVLVKGAQMENGDYTTIADYIETTKDKMFFISANNELWVTLDGLFTGKAYDRTVIFVNETPHAAAALVGETAGRAAGSFTYKFKTLKGVAAEELTDAQIAALHEAGAFGYVTKAGDDVTTEGISQSGQYIDIQDSIDYVIANIEHNVQKVLNKNAKIAYTDSGITVIANATTTALKAAHANGIIADKEDGTADYSVSFPLRSATTEADRASRSYKYGSFAFGLAGAIHEVQVHGTITQ